MDEMECRLVFAAGGTGGHLFPALAVAKEAGSRGAEVGFMCRERPAEMERIQREGFEAVGLPVEGFQRKPGLHWIRAALKAVRARGEARRQLKRRMPELVVGFGGYASFPAIAAAKQLGIPFALHEQNAWPGVVNRRFGTHATEVWCNDMEAARVMGWEHARHTGYPLMKPVREELREEPCPWPFEPGLPMLFVCGGSQGSLCINRAMTAALPRLRERCRFNALIQTGERTYAEFAPRLAGERTFVTPFVEEMDLAMAHSDVIVSRAGAGTLAEITAWGRASLLIPLAIAAGDHQTHNAMSLVSQGAAEMRREHELDGEELAGWLHLILTHPETREAMARKSRALGRLHRTAVRTIADRIFAVTGKGADSHGHGAERNADGS